MGRCFEVVIVICVCIGFRNGNLRILDNMTETKMPYYSTLIGYSSRHFTHLGNGLRSKYYVEDRNGAL
jgi:hypothetical protein